MAKASFGMLMEISLKGSGRTTRQMAMASTCTAMAHGTKATGKMTFNMEWEKKSGQITLCMRVCTMKVKSTARAFMYGLTGRPTMEPGFKTGSKARALTLGTTEEGTLVSGKIITCTASAFTPGKTAGSTKARTNTTRKTGMASTPGLMGGGTKATGAKASSTVLAGTFFQMAKSS